MKISTIRRKNLGSGPRCSPSEWARGWFAVFDQNQPNWRDWIDADAVELALVDISGDDSRQELDPVFLDAFSELLSQIRDENAKAIAIVQEAVAEISASPKLPDILQRVSTLFRRGLPLQDPVVRGDRKRVVIDFVEVMKSPILKVMSRFTNQLDWKERRHAQRHPLMSRPELVANAGAVTGGSAEENVWRAARRTLSETEKVLSTEAMTCLREFLKGKGKVTRQEAARAAAVSPATMTRALAVLQEIANRELGTSSDAVRTHFATALCSAVIST